MGVPAAESSDPNRSARPAAAQEPAQQDGASDDIVSYIPSLRAFARSLCRRDQDPDDLVQETLLRAIEYAHRYRPGTNMRAWLFRIMRSRFYNNIHRVKRETTGAAECASALPQTPPSQESSLQFTEMVAVLEQMPSHYRSALVLVTVLGESYASAAEILDCDIGTIKSRISRARSMLRRVLEETEP